MHPVYQSWVIAGKRCLKLTVQLPEAVIKAASASSPGGSWVSFFSSLVVFLVLCLGRGKREGWYLCSATALFLAFK